MRYDLDSSLFGARTIDLIVLSADNAAQSARAAHSNDLSRKYHVVLL